MIKPLKRLILISWFILILCFVVKLCGGNYFNIICNNNKIINLEKYKIFIYLVMYLITNCIYLLAVIGRMNFSLKQWLIIVPVFILFYFIKLWNSNLGLVIDIIRTFILPIFFKAKWYRIILAFILDTLFQFITLITKNLSLDDYITDNFIIAIIYMIDYYTMLILMYLYSNLIKESEFNMGAWWLGLVSDEETQKKSYSKFKLFWIRLWRFLTFYKKRNGL